jgi:endoglucanase
LRAAALAVLLSACGAAETSGDAAVMDDLTVAAADDLASSGGADAAADMTGPAVPTGLHTQSRWIVDGAAKRVKLAAVNWYGAEEKDFVVAGLDKQSRASIAQTIKTLGFNAVRLPWSNEGVESNPVVNAARLSANPDLVGLHALDVLDAVIAALSDQGLMVVIDNHMSNADWCCSTSDGNGLWHNAAYPEARWIADWEMMALRYKDVPAVIGADLRNELRQANGVDPTWGTGNANVDGTDWRAAAIRGATAVLGVAPRFLVFVEGLSFAGDLSGAYTNPILDADLPVAHRLVYEAHNYSNYVPNLTSYAQLKTALGNAWGFLLTQNMTFTAPVWVGEFGTCNTADSCVSSTNTMDQGFWFQSIRQYLTEADIDWSYWPLNGTEASGTSRTLGATETYGILAPDWQTPSRQSLLTALQMLQPATQGP